MNRSTESGRQQHRRLAEQSERQRRRRSLRGRDADAEHQRRDGRRRAGVAGPLHTHVRSGRGSADAHQRRHGHVGTQPVQRQKVQMVGLGD